MNERQKRIEILVTWWREVFPSPIEVAVKQYAYELNHDYALRYRDWSSILSAFAYSYRYSNIHHSIDEILILEAQKRWAVSRATARDYAHIVIQTTWNEMLTLIIELGSRYKITLAP